MLKQHFLSLEIINFSTAFVAVPCLEIWPLKLEDGAIITCGLVDISDHDTTTASRVIYTLFQLYQWMPLYERSSAEN